MSELALQLIEQNKQTKDKFLDLGNCGLTGLPDALLDCTWLESVNLGLYYYNETTPIFYTPNKGERNRLTPSSIAKLKHLPALKGLSLSVLEIDDLTGVQGLYTLRELLLGNNNIKNLAPLAGLRNLQLLDAGSNRIDNLGPLSGLVALQRLQVSNNQVSDLTPLQGLLNLQLLSLDTNKISELHPLAGLSNLEELYLMGNQLVSFEEKWLLLLSKLKHLEIWDNPIQNIPQEIYDQSNSLSNLKNYFRNRRNGSMPVYEAKIILVGNGRVGKTCLVKRLLENTFNPGEPSTHAIQLREWELNGLKEETGLEKIKANLWDFGGQDIYHATHRLFMHTKALFILVWDQTTQTEPFQTEVLSGGRSIRYKNHPLLYWLNYIKSRSGGSPVLVVQSKMKRDGKLNPPLTEEEKTQCNVWDTLSIDSAVERANGFRSLQTAVEEIITEQIQTTCTDIPAQWYRIREQVGTRQQQGVKQLSLEAFTGMCQAEGLDESATKTLLHYLHNSGVLFYREGLFGDQLVIDQKWAIDAVYALFDRRKGLVRNNRGEFSGYDLAEIWEDKTEEEQQLFVSFMKQCEICFEVKERENEREKTPFRKRTFIAPQLLPEEKPTALAFAFDGKEEAWYKYQHFFLHAAFMQRLIVRLGAMGDVHEMWQEGILLRMDKLTALVEALPQKSQLVVRIKGKEQLQLLERIEKELRIITAGEKGITKGVSWDGITYVDIIAIRTHPMENKRIKAEDGSWVEFADYVGFGSEMQVHDYMINLYQINGATQEVPHPIPAQEGSRPAPVIFFSYAWGEEREKIVDDLYDSLKKESYSLVRDKKDLGYWGLISDFIGKIGKGDVIVVALSDKYLRSQFCMHELYEIYRNSRLEEQELLKKIIPIQVESINYTDPDVLKAYFEHWKRLEEKWKALVNEYGADQKEHRKIEAIKNALRDLLPFIKYINTLSTEQLSANNFQIIKEAIAARVRESS